MSDLFANFKVRCSQISAVLAESRANPTLTEKQAARLIELQGKDKLTDNMQKEVEELLIKQKNSTKVILSDTCISYILMEYAWLTRKMASVTRELLDIPQMQKGIIVEQDSLNLLSIVDGVQYKPNVDEEGNRERVYNEYLSGEVDAYVGDSIMTATVIPDVKSIFDYPTLLAKIKQPLTTANEWQIKGYLDITGAREGFVANCLVNTDAGTIEGIKYRLLNKMRVATEENSDFKAKWKILERSMNFDSIPHHQRVFKKKVEPMNEFERTKLYDRVKVCREWLTEFHEEYSKINL